MTQPQIIYGIHAVAALLARAPAQVKVIYMQQGEAQRRLKQLSAQADQLGVVVEFVNKAQLLRQVGDQAHQGVVAVLHERLKEPADLETFLENLTEPPFLLVLDGVQDPHNLGACLRSANAAGVHALIVPKDRAVGVTAVVSKVACGAAVHTPVFRVTNLARTLKMLKKRGVWLYGATGEAKQTLWQTDLTGPVALVMGAEGQGIRRLTVTLCDQLIGIPMMGEIASLNVSVASGVCLFEVVRQKKLQNQ